MTKLIVRNKVPSKSAKSWSEAKEFENMMNRLFSNPFVESNSSTEMPIELTEKNNNIILKAILPGLEKENINIEVTEDRVNISGEYKAHHEENKDMIYRSEFFEGMFERMISLPQAINQQKAKADYKDGVLTITLPKSKKEMKKIVKLSL